MRLLPFVVLASTALALGASAGSGATAWSRISGPTQPGPQLGLARTADGVLHVIWNRGATSTSIFETRLSPAGKALGTSTVAGGFGGNLGLSLLVMPDRTLRLFAAGDPPGSTSGGINTFTAPAAGRAWSLQAGTYWGGAVAESSGVIGAALTKDGQAVTAWRGYAVPGIPPASIPQNPWIGDQTASHLATDAASGAVVLSGVTIAGKGGVFVQQVFPSPGRAVVLPLPFGFNDFYASLSGRLGAPGVYVAYADTRAMHLYRYGGASKTLARGLFTSAATCAGPDGRLWVAWGSSSSGLFVTRSNRAATAFEPVQKLQAPAGPGLTFVQCEGSAGPVDLFADSGGFFHAHLLAQLTASAAAAKRQVTLTVRDAGDPVPNAAVAIGGRHLRTAANGRVLVALRPGSYGATVSAPGYAPASLRVSVR
jgi:hypothetical protein